MNDHVTPKSAARKNMPMRRAQFDMQGFASWLAANGAEVGVPTNPYEVIRYRAFHDGSKRPLTHIVYAKENGLLNFQGGSGPHYAAFLRGDRVAGMFVSKFDPTRDEVVKAAKVSQSSKMRAKLIDRDGDECWFCGLAMGEDATLEHLIPKSKGGANSLTNYALAHAKCNHAAADLPLVKKIAMRDQMRAQHAN